MTTEKKVLFVLSFFTSHRIRPHSLLQCNVVVNTTFSLYELLHIVSHYITQEIIWKLIYEYELCVMIKIYIVMITICVDYLEPEKLVMVPCYYESFQWCSYLNDSIVNSHSRPHTDVEDKNDNDNVRFSRKRSHVSKHERYSFHPAQSFLSVTVVAATKSPFSPFIMQDVNIILKMFHLYTTCKYT